MYLLGWLPSIQRKRQPEKLMRLDRKQSLVHITPEATGFRQWRGERAHIRL